MKPRRSSSFELKVLIALLLLAALAGVLRARLGVINWQLLPELGAAASPLYLALSGAFWALGCLAAAVGLTLRQRWAPAFTRITSLALAAWYWLERLLLSASPLSQQNWPFSLAVTLLLLLYVFGTLALNAQKAYFES